MTLRKWFSMAAVLVAAAPAFGQADGSMRWTYNTGGPVVSSPSVGPDGVIYVGSQSKRVFAINPDGSTKWIFPTGFLVNTDWFESSPTVGDDGTVYAGSYDGNLYALDGATGTEKWRYSTNAYILSSVAIGPDGTLYFGAGDASLHALNPDGTPKWEFATGDWVDSSPAIGTDGTIYVGSWDKSLYAINPNGTLKWSVATGDAILSSPAIGPDGTVYVGSTDGKLWAVREDGSVAWTFTAGDSVEGGPAVAANGNILFGSADGFFYALRPDGTQAWASPYDAGQGIFSGVSIRSDGTILFGASDNRIHALNADGTLKWRFATGFVVDSTPAIGPDGTIYVGSFDRLVYALNGNGNLLAEAPWPKFRADALNQGRYSGSSAPVAPTVVVQPQSQTVDFGTAVSFSVEASGSLPLSFQWSKDGVEIPGATDSAYSIPQATTEDAGAYSVLVSNSAGSVTSDSAVLTVNSPDAPVIDVEPRALTVGLGARMSLWVEVTGSEPILYQWQKDGVDIPGATGAFYEVDPVTAADAGSYSVVVSNAGGVVTSSAAAVGVASAVDATLVNLSTRAFVGAGQEGLLIPGFVTFGTGEQQLLIRAVGPTLEEIAPGIGAITDPTLTIFSGSTTLLTNDNWEEAANAGDIASTAAAVGAFPLSAGSKDAAALISAPAGGFTVQVTGVNGSTGVSLVEIYDAGATGGTGRLVNLSTRADAGDGSQVMIPGFAVEGTTAKTLLIRAVGPSLERFGVTGFITDPVLKIFDPTGTQILEANDWGDAPDVPALVAATTAVGAFDLDVNSADAATLIVLMPGSYTAQATGAGGETGNVLVEVYEVQ